MSISDDYSDFGGWSAWSRLGLHPIGVIRWRGRSGKMCAIRQRERGEMMGFVWWLIIVFFWVIFLSFTMSVARSKGHSPLLWGLLACFLPGITLIIVLLLPNRALV